ncbi:MAG TPA: iron ABC transporter permease [Candidatus Corynebacterium gallistercoris]|uniref:Iron ABC transporter permease n=1 Tax=Candidatus Corynebacterium gallistercoris TaxID=2838530 RepID=A0A9D1UQL4_9CORY|nr:iron ABC transporter permease [Candidatus Corynebacterium gallistercoris]
MPSSADQPAHTAAEILGRRGDNRRSWLWLNTLSIALALSILAGIALGPVSIPLTTTAQVLSHHLVGTALPTTEIPTGRTVLTHAQLSSIIWEVRAPRIILAATVGAGLALTGAILQAITRNVLADPYILGVHSGASCGAAAAILFGVGAGLGDYGLQGSAFAGALAATALVFGIARGKRTRHAANASALFSSTRLLLSGVAVGYALSSATSFLVFASDSPEASRSVMFWLLGSLGLATWSGPLAVTIIVTSSAALFLITLAPRIDALASGDAAATSVGINPSRLRGVLLVVTCLVVGVLVSMSGAIGFVGLVIPHIARWLVGYRHRWVLPLSAILGSILLIWADILSRMLLAPQEIPVGIITALVGAPFLLLLLRKTSAV